MGGLARWLLIASIALALGGCSFRKMVDRLVSDEDRALAMGVIEDIRSRDATAFDAILAPEIKADSLPQLAAAAGYFPATPGKTEFIAYSTNSHYENGKSSSSKSFTLVTTDEKTWTTTKLQFESHGGPLRLTVWNVEGSPTKPADLQTLETVDKVLPIVGMIILIFAIGLIALIVVLVRRSQRRDRELGIRPPR